MYLLHSKKKWNASSRGTPQAQFGLDTIFDLNKSLENRQHNGQKTEEQTTQWPKEKDRRTDNTMTKRKRQKNRQHNGQKKKTEEQTTQWAKEKEQKDKQQSTTIIAIKF